jgi:hypothetical protein
MGAKVVVGDLLDLNSMHRAIAHNPPARLFGAPLWRRRYGPDKSASISRQARSSARYSALSALACFECCLCFVTARRMRSIPSAVFGPVSVRVESASPVGQHKELHGL